MNNAIHTFLVISLVSSFFVSCQKDTIIQKHNAPETPAPAEQMGGTDSAGGGNGVKGKPLDAFIEPHFIELPAFKKIVVPIINKLKSVDAKVAGDFYHISLNRDWYFVPVDLELISGRILGSYGRTDQLALQDLNKIWVNSNFYNEMEIQYQGALIVHELIMGMRLLQYQHRQDVCIAEHGSLLSNGMAEGDLKAYQKEKNSCRSTYPKIVGTTSGQPFRLNADDYDLVRKIVALILTKEIPKLEEAVILIKSSKLRNYE